MAHGFKVTASDSDITIDEEEGIMVNCWVKICLKLSIERAVDRVVRWSASA